MKTAKSLKRTPARQASASSPLSTALNATKAEMEAAAKRLGYDVSRKNWLERLRSESRSYPYTLEESEFCAALTPIRIHARMRALELIDSIMEEIAKIEEDHLIDKEVVELRARLAAAPIPVSVAVYIKQADREVA
jgi:hypothetical protein